MPERLRFMNAAGVPGYLWIEDRTLYIEHPDFPGLNQQVGLGDVDMDRLAGQILDVRDAEARDAEAAVQDGSWLSSQVDKAIESSQRMDIDLDYRRAIQKLTR